MKLSSKQIATLQVATGLILYLIGTATLLLLNFQLELGIILLAAHSIAAILVWTDTSMPQEQRYIKCALFIIAIVLGIAWLGTYQYNIYLIAVLLSIFLGMYLVISTLIYLRKQKIKTKRSFLRRAVAFFAQSVAGLASVFSLIITLFFVVTAITPDPLIETAQYALHVSNSFQPAAASKQAPLADGTIYINDVQYANTYPNSYLDIYHANGYNQINLPTYFYVHGGGWAWGDKVMGDPDATTNGFPQEIQSLILAGYNVVSMNYAFSPAYTYPVPLVQLSQAVQFLQQHGAQYGISMSKVIFAGGSAGGQLVGQFANIQTNPEYAKEMGISPVMKREDIGAVVLLSALIDGERLAETGNAGIDFLFFELGRAYFRTGFFAGNSTIIQSSIIYHVTTNYPPTFITDGNTGSFADQARDLHNKLDSLHVTNEFNFYTTSQAILGHGYDTGNTAFAQDNMKKIIAFLNTNV